LLIVQQEEDMDIVLDSPGELPPLTGDESLAPGATVRDFWAWALGDLRLNSTRGILAQFLVARALGDDRARNDGWGDYDVLTPEGIRVEVKSSGYLQSWGQRGVSRIVFSGLKARAWSDATGYSADAEFRADVYVFAVHTSTDRTKYDPLDLGAWVFWVAPVQVIAGLDQKTITLSRVEQVASGPLAWHDLDAAVRAAAPTIERRVP
jgi:hypothetical protein